LWDILFASKIQALSQEGYKGYAMVKDITALLPAAKQGNQKAIAELYSLMSADMAMMRHKYGRRLPYSLWEDVAQLVDVGFMKAVYSYVPSRGASFRTWFYLKAQYEVCNWVRHETTKGRKADISTPQDIISTYPDNEVDYIMPLRVGVAVAALPERERKIVTMRMEGKTLAEIARSMGITRERVRQIEGKAHRTLKKKLYTLRDYK
jgi:RNA polymerase sigma factor (sigma-70 family)